MNESKAIIWALFCTLIIASALALTTVLMWWICAALTITQLIVLSGALAVIGIIGIFVACYKAARNR